MARKGKYNLENLEKRLIRKALEKYPIHIAAIKLGIGESTLFRKRKKYKLI